MNRNPSTGHMFQFRSWGHRQIAFLRVGVGVWLLVLTAIIYRAGVGGPWEWPLVAVAALHFALAYRLFRIARTDPGRNLKFR